MPRIDWKRTYHESGKIHTTDKGNKTGEVWHTPLKSLKGPFNLTTINIGNAKSFIKAQHPRCDYSGKKSDSILTIDTRVIPKSVQTNIAIGLLEPYNFDALNRILTASSPPQQILISLEVKPWVYALLFWFSEFEEIIKHL
ncbi:MAG: hypothetical protein E3J56_11720 [Candidatus Aminicenantes bacterium]|nr:MAG: hypothetical protein E3J56_11720 [Candidatus Aminicenantes bacterium]